MRKYLTERVATIAAATANIIFAGLVGMLLLGLVVVMAFTVVAAWRAVFG